ncbi:MAG: peptidylprolyl isomerase [Betaproteobacteria bacterium]|jgi:FKBP-type peptidyl-prolyl cis-trans isomerase SlyD|nr:FKBP-type peptidyl-prolyl cis-trans isomerase [Burkholderiales bacterium]
MNITNDCVVALTWVLKDTQGEILDELDDPVEFYLGGHDLLDKIQQALQDHEVGDLLDLHLEPEEAFGDFDELLVFLEPRALFPVEIEEGMTIEGHALPKGCNQDAPKDVIYTITDIYPEHVVIDGNHPLSGMALRISLKITGVRHATSQEISHGTCGSGFFSLPPTPGSDLLH